MTEISSFWLQYHPEEIAFVPKIGDKDEECDVEVAIIGGGISGVGVAYWLKKAGFEGKVVLYEGKSHLSHGATGRNGGHLWPHAKIPSKEMVEKFGMDEMIKIYKFEHKVCRLVEQFIDECRQDPIDVKDVERIEFVKTGGLDLVQTKEEAEELFRKFQELEKYSIGSQLGHEFWDSDRCKEATGSDAFSGALYQREAAQLWPRKLVHLMAKRSERMGVEFVLDSMIKEVSMDSNGLSCLKFEGGSEIRAKRVVFATNGYSSSLLPQLKGIIVPVRGQILCTSPVDIITLPSLAQYDSDYLIHRRSDRRIIFGGMRNKSSTKEVDITNDEETHPEVGRGLREFLDKCLPKLKEQKDFKIEREWTGIMGFSIDDNPLVGPLPNTNGNHFIIAGFTGHGMPRAFGCSKTISDMILGTVNEEEIVKPFLPNRFPQL